MFALNLYFQSSFTQLQIKKCRAKPVFIKLLVAQINFKRREKKNDFNPTIRIKNRIKEIHNIKYLNPSNVLIFYFIIQPVFSRPDICNSEF